MEEKQKDITGAPEEVTGVPNELASEVNKEEEEAIKEATGEVVPPPLARRMKAWDYWTS